MTEYLEESPDAVILPFKSFVGSTWGEPPEADVVVSDGAPAAPWPLRIVTDGELPGVDREVAMRALTDDVKPLWP